MSLTIRPFEDRDYEPMCALRNIIYPRFPTTPELMRYHDENSDPKCKRQLWVAEWEGQFAGIGLYAQSSWSYHPQHFMARLYSHPDLRNRGIGTALYQTVIEALEELRYTELKAMIDEDQPEGLHFAQKHGFVEVERLSESELELASMNLTAFEGALEKAASHGIEIRSYAELQADPDRNRKIYEMHSQVMQDVPWDGAHTQPEFETFCKQFSSPQFLPDLYFLAMHEERCVGMSALWGMAREGYLDTGLTGMLREYRGKGIASALKVRALTAARAKRYTHVKTENHVENRPMLTINERLGFTKVPGVIIFAKRQERNES